MSNDEIELKALLRGNWKYEDVQTAYEFVRSRGLEMEFRLPWEREREGVGPKPKATIEEINQRALNNLHKAVKNGDVEDARSWAGLLAMLS